MRSIATSAEKIVNVALTSAVGPRGQPGNVEDIIYTAKRLGLVYRRLLEWTAEFRHAESDETYAPVLRILEKFSENAISDLEGFSRRMQQELEGAVRRYETTKELQKVGIMLELTSPELKDLDTELHKLVVQFGAANRT